MKTELHLVNSSAAQQTNTSLKGELKEKHVFLLNGFSLCLLFRCGVMKVATFRPRKLGSDHRIS